MLADLQRDRPALVHSKGIPMTIVTNYWMKPIPQREFDWAAYLSDDEPDDNGHMLIGYGRTADEAIADLEMLLEDRQ
jgi:hypothetical protein